MRDGDRPPIARHEAYKPDPSEQGPRRGKLNGAARQPFQILKWEDLSALPEPEPLIKHLLDCGALSVVFGASNSGKTFFALDVALHVALGWDWRGFRTQKGPVLYIAAEAGKSISKRLTAFRYHHEIEADGVELYVLPDSLDMCRAPDQTDQLAAEIAERVAAVKFALIVVDTLSRVMGRGNENAPDDMGALIANCDRLRQMTEAHVMLVHHTGKDVGKAERGHSALRAAVDTAIEVVGDNGSGAHSATVQKQRDGSSGQVFGFKLLRVEIGKDEDDGPISSCVVEAMNGAAPSRPRRKALKAAAQLGLTELNNCIVAHADDPTPTPVSDDIPRGIQGVTKARWRARLEKAGVINAEGNPREQLRRIVVTLKDAGLIGVWEDFVWPVTNRHEASQ